MWNIIRIYTCFTNLANREGLSKIINKSNKLVEWTFFDIIYINFIYDTLHILLAKGFYPLEILCKLHYNYVKLSSNEYNDIQLL